MRRFVFTMLMVFVFVMSSFAQFADLPPDEITVDLLVSGDRNSQSHSLTSVLPIATVEGWAGVYARQTVVDGSVVSEVVLARLQGGGTVEGIGIQAFVEGERDHVKGIDFASRLGYFLRFGVHEFDGLVVSGGAGNFIESVAVREELGIEDDDSIVRWMIFTSLDYRGWATLLKFTPNLHFADRQVSVESAIGIQVKENVDVRFRGSLGYFPNSFNDSSFETRYESGIQFGF